MEDNILEAVSSLRAALIAATEAGMPGMSTTVKSLERAIAEAECAYYSMVGWDSSDMKAD